MAKGIAGEALAFFEEILQAHQLELPVAGVGKTKGIAIGKFGPYNSTIFDLENDRLYKIAEVLQGGPLIQRIEFFGDSKSPMVETVLQQSLTRGEGVDQEFKQLWQGLLKLTRPSPLEARDLIERLKAGGVSPEKYYPSEKKRSITLPVIS